MIAAGIMKNVRITSFYRLFGHFFKSNLNHFCVRIALIYKFSGGAYMKERILIMEDETAIQAVLYELLTDTGYGAY